MKAAEAKSSAATKTAKKISPFFNKEGGQDFFHTTVTEQPFFSKTNTAATGIQPKLTVGEPYDQYEQEADAMADKVVQRQEEPAPAIQKKTEPLINKVTPVVQKCAACEGSSVTPKSDKQEEKPDMEEDKEKDPSTKVQKKPVFENLAPPDGHLQRRCRECEEGGEVFLKPMSGIQRKTVNDNAPNADGSRESIVAMARTMIGKIEAKHDDGSGRRVGADQLLEIFHIAAPGVWDDGTVENINGQLPSWCGIFTVWAHKKAGKDIGTWQMGKGVSAFGTLTQTTSPEPGDIGYMDEKLQHHCIIVKVEGDTVHSIDGNSGNFSEVKENQRPLSIYLGFFTAFGAGSSGNVQRKEDNAVQTKSSGGSTADASIEQQLNSAKGSGQSLPDTTRSNMEQNFGVDFSGVKIHTDSSAVEMNKDLHAQAFTHGSDIYFNNGKFDPESSSGKHLLAHELTHTVQQGAAIQKKSVPDIQKNGLTEDEIKDKLAEPIEDWNEIADEYQESEEYDEFAYSRRVVILLLWGDKKWITTDEDIELFIGDCEMVAEDEYDTADEFTGAMQEFVLDNTPAFPLIWSDRIYDALYLDVDQKSLDEDAKDEWKNVEKVAGTLPAGILEKGLPVPFDEALTIKEFDMSMKWIGSDKNNVIVDYAKAGSAYIKKRWTSNFFIMWNAIAENIADRVAEGEISVGPLSYQEFIEKKQKGLRELAQTVADARDELTLDKIHTDTIALKDLAVLQGLASGLLALIPALMHWRYVRELFNEELKKADALIITKDSTDKATIAFMWAYENGYFGVMGERLWAGIKEHGWLILGMLIGFILVQYVPILNIAVDALVLITSGVGAIKSMIALKETFDKVAKVKNVLGMQRGSAVMAQSITVDGIQLILDLLVVVAALKAIKIRAAKIKAENPGMAEKEAMDKALKEANTKEGKILQAAKDSKSFLAKHGNSALAKKVLSYAEGDLELAEKLMKVFNKAKDADLSLIDSMVKKLVAEADSAVQTEFAELIKAHPDLLLKVRNTSELQIALEKLGKPLNFEKVQLFRKMVAGFNRVAFISASKESLLLFLERVWASRKEIMDKNTSVYKLYSSATEANPLTKKPELYLAEVDALKAGRPQGSVFVPQGSAEKGFHHFYRAGADTTKVTERIYLNINADNATQVMEHVVRNIIDNPTAFPGVAGGKITGPLGVSGRPDAIVIYLEDAAAAKKVLQSMNGLKSSNPSYFMKSVPPMTKQVSEGVSVAQEPLPAGSDSFGSHRSKVITQALEDTVTKNGTKEQFVKKVEEIMPQQGIDPNNPHLNQPPTIQPKLKTGQQNDPYEEEADEMADRVVLQPKCDDCEKEDAVQKKEEEKKISALPENNNKNSNADTAFAGVLQLSQGNGANLDDNTRTEMEAGFNTDFSDVKIHTGTDAVQMNEQIHAQAFTHGKDIYFNSGKYDPGSASGKHLLAHELTHTVQQTGDVMRKPEDSSEPVNNNTGQPKDETPYMKSTRNRIDHESVKTTTPFFQKERTRSSFDGSDSNFFNPPVVQTKSIDGQTEGVPEENAGAAETPGPATATAATAAGGAVNNTAALPVSAVPLIVEDAETPGQGQLRKSEFLDRLNASICQTVDSALQGTPYSSNNCPYIITAFNTHRNSPPAVLQSLLERYAPGTKAAKNANEFIQLVQVRVLTAVSNWKKTGDLSEVPPEIAARIPGGEIMVSMSKAAGGLATGISNAASAVSGLFFNAKAGGAQATQSPATVMQSLGKGNAIEGGTRAKMETAFGTDFSGVQVHTDNTAANLSGQMNARAFTVGNHVAFGSNEYRPGTLVGDALMAHELAHVEQQKQAVLTKSPDNTANKDLEEDADDAALQAMGQMSEKEMFGPDKKQIRKRSKLLSGLQLQRCDGCGGSKTVTEEQALEYLKKLNTSGAIEATDEGKQKARVVVELWQKGLGQFILSPRLKILLIQEFTSGQPTADGGINIPAGDQEKIVALIKGAGKEEVDKIFGAIAEKTILTYLTDDNKKNFETHVQGLKSTGKPQDVFDADEMIKLRDKFQDNATQPKGTRLECIDILRGQLADAYKGDKGQGDVKQAASKSGTARTVDGRELGDNTLPNFMSYMADFKLTSTSFVTDFTREAGTRKPLALREDAWNGIVTMVGDQVGWHLFTMALMDGYHSITLMVEKRPDAMFLYFADQNDTSRQDLVEEGSMPGFKRYEGQKFNDYVTFATKSFWDGFYEKKKAANPTLSGDALLRKADSRTTLSIWKLQKKGPTAAPAPAPVPASKAPKTYKVQKGDSLSKIADKFNIPVADIQKLNKMGNSTKIKIGQTLTLHE